MFHLFELVSHAETLHCLSPIRSTGAVCGGICHVLIFYYMRINTETCCAVPAKAQVLRSTGLTPGLCICQEPSNFEP